MVSAVNISSCINNGSYTATNIRGDVGNMFFFFVWKLERSSGKSEEEGLEHEIVWHAGQKKETPGN